jgi:hypothetical protein
LALAALELQLLLRQWGAPLLLAHLPPLAADMAAVTIQQSIPLEAAVGQAVADLLALKLVVLGHLGREMPGALQSQALHPIPVLAAAGLVRLHLTRHQLLLVRAALAT